VIIRFWYETVDAGKSTRRLKHLEVRHYSCWLQDQPVFDLFGILVFEALQVLNFTP